MFILVYINSSFFINLIVALFLSARHLIFIIEEILSVKAEVAGVDRKRYTVLRMLQKSGVFLKRVRLFSQVVLDSKSLFPLTFSRIWFNSISAENKLITLIFYLSTGFKDSRMFSNYFNSICVQIEELNLVKFESTSNQLYTFVNK